MKKERKKGREGRKKRSDRGTKRKNRRRRRKKGKIYLLKTFTPKTFYLKGCHKFSLIRSNPYRAPLMRAVTYFCPSRPCLGHG